MGAPPHGIAATPCPYTRGHRQLVRLRLRRYARFELGMPRLCQSGHAGDLGPGLKGLGPGGSIQIGGDVVAAEMEEVVDLVVSGEETLCLPRRLKALHLSFSSSGRLVRILSSVIQSFVLPMLDARHDLPLCRTVTRQLVGDHDARRPAL